MPPYSSKWQAGRQACTARIEYGRSRAACGWVHRSVHVSHTFLANKRRKTGTLECWTHASSRTHSAKGDRSGGALVKENEHAAEAVNTQAKQEQHASGMKERTTQQKVGTC